MFRVAGADRDRERALARGRRTRRASGPGPGSLFGAGPGTGESAPVGRGPAGVTVRGYRPVASLSHRHAAVTGPGPEPGVKATVNRRLGPSPLHGVTVIIGSSRLPTAVTVGPSGRTARVGPGPRLGLDFEQ